MTGRRPPAGGARATRESAGPVGIPIAPTPFLGRESLLEDLLGRLRRPDCRLLTLTGPPGVGKTRLAMELADALRPDFPDGVFFVPLAALADPGLVAATIAKAVKLREEGFSSVELALHAYLHDKAILLVLDNFEHLSKAAGLVGNLLRATRKVHVLVTSSVALRLYGEREHQVPPLPLPPTATPASPSNLEGNAAVSLFVARARAVRPSFELDDESAGPVSELCHRLEGIPLAIELAAARSKLFGPRALLDRLDHRFTLLRGGPRDLPERQQSLQAALDWSYDLLEPGERQLLQSAAVFAHGFTLEAAEAVCDGGDPGSDLARHIEALLDHSLLHSEAGADGSVRFSMLDTIREYALDRLEAAPEDPARPLDALRRAHAEHFVGLAEAAESGLRGEDQPVWLKRLEAEHANLRAALTWSLDTAEGDLGRRLAGALWEFWLMHGHLSEARRWLEGVLALPGAGGAPRAKAFCGAGIMARFQGDFVASRTRLEESAALWREIGNDWGLANALTYLGTTERYVGAQSSARDHLDESLALWRDIGDRWGLALALSARAGLANDEEEYEHAHGLREESLALYREVGDADGEARALIGLGEVARCTGHYEDARAWYEQGLERFRELGSRLHVAVTLQNLGHATSHLADVDEANRCFVEGLVLFRSLGHQVGAAACLVGLAGLEISMDHPESAARLLGAADHITEELGTMLAAADRLEWENHHSAAERALGTDAFLRAKEEGAMMGVEGVVAAARGDGTAGPDSLERVADDGAGSARPRKGGGIVELTAREIDVLELLAEGLTYAQIGERLSISPRTVDAHLRSVYAKLDVTSRHAAVRRATQRNLI